MQVLKLECGRVLSFHGVTFPECDRQNVMILLTVETKAAAATASNEEVAAYIIPRETGQAVLATLEEIFPSASFETHTGTESAGHALMHTWSLSASASADALPISRSLLSPAAAAAAAAPPLERVSVRYHHAGE
jgi:hypothetical protein